MKIIVGIDLDNTIVNYGPVFKKIGQKFFQRVTNNDSDFNKESIKSLLLRNNKLRLWNKIQGKVYGSYINDAILYSGVIRFLLFLKYLNIRVYIISHKTKYGHYDKNKINLREVALKWIENNLIINGETLIESRCVYFCDTQDEKIETIRLLKCNIFIDDLLEIVANKSLDSNITKILFNQTDKLSNDGYINLKNWGDITNSIINEKQILLSLKNYLLNKCGIEVKEIKKYELGGNNNFYYFKDSRTEYALKLYSESDINRARREVECYKFLESTELSDFLLKFIKHDPVLNAAIFKWENKVRENCDINTAIDFIYTLNKISKRSKKYKYQAKDALFSLIDYEHDIKRRILTLNNSIYYENIRIFLNDVIEYKQSYISENYNVLIYIINLYKDHSILSPSDFGFHNSMCTDSGVKWFDFEYFGYDSPLKLIVDFLIHPAMSLNVDEKMLWLNKMMSEFEINNSISSHIKTVWPLLGIKWILIILNEYCEDVWYNKILAKPTLKQIRKSVLIQQKLKAEELFSNIKEFEKKFPIW